MKLVCLFLIFAILSNGALGRSYRHKRQVNQDTTAVNQAAIQACIRSCPVTSEYNPVCGSNGVTYDNPGRLLCAQACGIAVNQLRAYRCPPPTAAPTS